MKFFEVTHKDKKTKARTGIIHTDHGSIETPEFMPVGTQATIKSLDSSDIENLDAQIILANTYHLHLRPGEDLIADFGGLHKFMNWDKPILTDSGGFQVFSLSRASLSDRTESKTTRDLSKKKNINKPKSNMLAKIFGKKDLSLRSAPLEINLNNQGKLVKIDDDGVTFQSHIDGSKHRFTPENAIEIQHKLGADIIMAFDECTPDQATLRYARQALERTHSWAERCITQHEKTKNQHGYNQFLFGIIQGAGHKKLRQESAKVISSMDFDGIAIGGESIGYNMKATKKILDWVNPIIPEDKPHYTMGVGFSPTDLFDVVERGVDMFDCVSPTRVARNGRLFVSPLEGGKGGVKHHINILNSKFRTDKNPIDPQCTCSTCQNYSRAYIHHLFKAQELTAYRLATIHNLHFMLDLMKQIREAIKEDKFTKLKKQWT